MEGQRQRDQGLQEEVIGVENVREMLAREATEAKDVADAEARGEREPAPGQRARRQAGEASQVYSVRIPVDRLAQLRRLADERDVAPTALLRQFVLERLDQETAAVVTDLRTRDVNELRLGPSRSAEPAEIVPLHKAAR
jgi:hypothetical protein